MNHHSRRGRSPLSGYDPRIMPTNRIDYDDPYHPQNHFDGSPHQPQPGGPPLGQPPFLDHGPQHNFPMNYRDQHRLPSTYRETLSHRDQYAMSGPPGPSPPLPPQQMQRSVSPPYKILCITNINPKIGDASVKDALTNDYCRFGDISVSICHDSGERLAYIYFRNYEEAREARHIKSRTLFFDRPVEIEPIYDPRANGSPPPIDSSPSGILGPPMSAIYSPRKRSVTPPDYPYEMNGPMGHRRQPPPPPPPPHYNNNSYKHQSPQASIHQHQQARGISPIDYRPPPMPPHPGPYQPAISPHDRRAGYGGGYGPSPPHMSHPNSPPYSSPPHQSEPYRSSHPANHPNYPVGVPPFGGGNGGSGPPIHHSVHRERAYNETTQMNSRSSRSDPYSYPVNPRGYYHAPPLPTHQSSSRTAPNQSSGSSYHQPMNAHDIPHHHLPSYRSSQQPPPVYNQYHHHRPAPDPPVRYLSREYRREKFGADHMNSEMDDGRPSRVLLVNNIDSTKTESELRDTFGPFGIIEEMELKKVAPDLSSALIKFSSMDGAYKAKTANNGRHIGNTRCRIVYGKVSASRRLWIGGLSPATTIPCLEDECGKFGDIVSMDYTSGRPYAYVEYESANQAQFAAHHLRTTLTPANERKIRIEFVDPERSEKILSGNDSNSQISETGSKSRTTNESLATSELEPSPQSTSGRKRSLTPTELSANKRQAYGLPLGANTFKQERLAAAAAAKARTSSTSSLGSHQHHVEEGDKQNELVIDDNSADHPVGNGDTNCANLPIRDEPPSEDILGRCTSIREIVQNCFVSWLSQLALRNFIFPSRIYLCSGHKQFVDKFLAKSNDVISENGTRHYPVLRITQRWRLHPQPKLEEVKRRMQSGNLGIFIITASGYDDEKPQRHIDATNSNDQSASSKGIDNSDANDHNLGPNKASRCEMTDTGAAIVENSTPNANSGDGNAANQSSQSRPLRNLISYLEQKDAAGVISLNANEADQVPTTPTGASSGVQEGNTKLLYVFPPCDFALNLLKQKASNLKADATKEEYLLGVLVGSNEAKV